MQKFLLKGKVPIGSRPTETARTVSDPDKLYSKRQWPISIRVSCLPLEELTCNPTASFLPCRNIRIITVYRLWPGPGPSTAASARRFRPASLVSVRGSSSRWSWADACSR